MHCVFLDTAFAILFITGLCDGNTYLVREHFYVDIHKGWYSAKYHCTTHYTDLSSVLTEDDDERVLNVVPGRATTSAWIGLFQRNYNRQIRWTWSVYMNVDFEKWAVGQPSFDENYCGYTREGLWYSTLCTDALPFFCFKTYNRMLTVVQEMLPWENALDYCRSKYTDLSSLHSKYTAEQVINSTTGVTTDFVWTGLRFLMGRWYWLNEDPLYYLVWSNTAHSQCPALPLRCGALSVKDKIFEARSCEEELNFICY